MSTAVADPLRCPPAGSVPSTRGPRAERSAEGHDPQDPSAEATLGGQPGASGCLRVSQDKPNQNPYVKNTQKS